MSLAAKMDTPPHDPLILKTLLADLEQGDSQRARKWLVVPNKKTAKEVSQAPNELLYLQRLAAQQNLPERLLNYTYTLTMDSRYP